MGFHPLRLIGNVTDLESQQKYCFLNINNVYFENMVSQIYPSELQLNKANTSDTKAAFLDLHFVNFYHNTLPKFMINVTTLILKLSISHF